RTVGIGTSRSARRGDPKHRQGRDLISLAAPAWEPSLDEEGPDVDTTQAAPARTHDRYIDAVRALALLAVVFGHWVATLPRTRGAEVIGTDHLLHLWSPAASITWIWQVVPL